MYTVIVTILHTLLWYNFPAVTIHTYIQCHLQIMHNYFPMEEMPMICKDHLVMIVLHHH